MVATEKTNSLDVTKTIIPLALVASQLTAHSALRPHGLLVDSEPIRAQGIIVKYSLD